MFVIFQNKNQKSCQKKYCKSVEKHAFMVSLFMMTLCDAKTLIQAFRACFPCNCARRTTFFTFVLTGHMSRIARCLDWQMAFSAKWTRRLQDLSCATEGFIQLLTSSRAHACDISSRAVLLACLPPSCKSPGAFVRKDAKKKESMQIMDFG